MFFQNPPYMAFRQLLIQRIAVVGTSFSPLPRQAWHGYGATSAHRVEVEVGADGHANAPPSGAAAAAPPAGAMIPCFLRSIPLATRNVAKYRSRVGISSVNVHHLYRYARAGCGRCVCNLRCIYFTRAPACELGEWYCEQWTKTSLANAHMFGDEYKNTIL
jgi:hypothetical protein